jgi:hypothetical protein
LKLLFSIIFIFFTLLASSGAEELYNCVDSKGNKIITSTPQDSMKCWTGSSEEEPVIPKKPAKSKDEPQKNLVDICEKLYAESEEISTEISSFDPRLADLQKEEVNIRQDCLRNNCNGNTQYKLMNSMSEERNQINKQISLLYEKRQLINIDLSTYKCDQLKWDLSRSSQGIVTSTSSSSSSHSSYKIRKSIRR